MYDKLLILMNVIYCLRIIDKGSIRLENDNTKDYLEMWIISNDDNNSTLNKLEGGRGGEKYFDENLGTTRTQHNHQDGEEKCAQRGREHRRSEHSKSRFQHFLFTVSSTVTIDGRGNESL
ncbi:unnamed protein product [Brugia pahangi]|uniref:Uncharacterized protein n=1 Tax=Brugia pahangi TaxID=6280 RepID=A0A0N4SYL3_BRUPA|nr:unnamed protein product [Brugia pahangi]